jgi:N-acetyl-anhydromuramyl-L-alanine amidase AmpD
MDGSLSGTDTWFADPASGVSAHYGIGKSGEVHQYVQDKDIAYHAGIPYPCTWVNQSKNRYPGTNPNSYSIGIENEGKILDIWPTEQIQALAALIAGKCKQYSIPVDDLHIVGHHEIYAGHNCPGPNCPLEDIIKLAAVMITA